MRKSDEKMKSVLYITNIQSPYREVFFEKLSEFCNLTVLYERKKSDNRDDSWSLSQNRNFKKCYLHGIKTGRETSFSLAILKYIFGDYDVIIIGCYNSPIQMLAIILLRFFKKKFVINTDGELFIGNSGIKNILKRFFLKGANAYMAPGDKTSKKLQDLVGDKPVFNYHMSSLTVKEIKHNSSCATEKRKNFIFVIGQYFPYKGMDIALNVAKLMPNEYFVFTGMGKRTDLFKKECKTNLLNNVKIFSFLPEDEFVENYKKCKCVLLPSRKECWGLVVNEAASFGAPIISTYGAGAAVEFLQNNHSELLANPNSAEDIKHAIELFNHQDKTKISNYLINKSKKYSIEQCVNAHMEMINLI